MSASSTGTTMIGGGGGGLTRHQRHDDAGVAQQPAGPGRLEAVVERGDVADTRGLLVADGEVRDHVLDLLLRHARVSRGLLRRHPALDELLQRLAGAVLQRLVAGRRGILGGHVDPDAGHLIGWRGCRGAARSARVGGGRRCLARASSVIAKPQGAQEASGERRRDGRDDRPSVRRRRRRSAMRQRLPGAFDPLFSPCLSSL